MFQNISSKVNPAELNKLFNNINESQYKLIEHNYYDYQNKIYNNIIDFDLQDKYDISEKTANYFSLREMNLIYYNLLIGNSKISTYINDNFPLESDKGAVIAVFHYGIYQIVPYLISRHTNKNILIYANEEISNSLLNIIESIEGKMPDNLKVLPLDYKSVLKAVRAVKNGDILLIMPEIDLGSTEKDEKSQTIINFLGKKLIVPSGPLKIASMTKMPVYSLYIEEDIDSLSLNLKEIIEQDTLQNSVSELWKCLENTVQNKPHKWSVWERIDDLLYED